jgi:hypothetical protein
MSGGFVDSLRMSVRGFGRAEAFRGKRRKKTLSKKCCDPTVAEYACVKGF